jgi:hypothetical protein
VSVVWSSNDHRLEDLDGAFPPSVGGRSRGHMSSSVDHANRPSACVKPTPGTRRDGRGLTCAVEAIIMTPIVGARLRLARSLMVRRCSAA